MGDVIQKFSSDFLLPKYIKFCGSLFTISTFLNKHPTACTAFTAKRFSLLLWGQVVSRCADTRDKQQQHLRASPWCGTKTWGAMGLRLWIVSSCSLGIILVVRRKTLALSPCQLHTTWHCKLSDSAPKDERVGGITLLHIKGIGRLVRAVAASKQAVKSSGCWRRGSGIAELGHSAGRMMGQEKLS